MSFIFAACQKFNSSCGESWTRYIEWSGYDQIQEIVSADSILCPSLIDELIDDDWNFNIHADNRVYLFRDFEYLMRRVNYDPSHHNILALTEQPVKTPFYPSQFTFCGYDILDSDDSISVLLNCGAFPSIFSAADLNPLGLLDELGRATTIADNIRKAHPDDSHCGDCRVWGIARLTNS